MILETERLILRELKEEDALHFYELNNDPTVIQFTGDSPFKDIDSAKKILKNYSRNNYEKYGYGRWAVLSKTNNEWLGWCGLKYTPEKEETDIGYRFYKKHWGNGYATEAAKACLDYGFKKLHLSKIVGRSMKENIASIVVLKKIGMIYEKEFMMDGKYPAVTYCILNNLK